MENNNTAVNENEKTAATSQADTSASVSTQDDAEAKIAALEAEKAKYLEEAANYKAAYFKEKSRNRGESSEELEETEEEKIRRIAREEAARNKIVEIDTEKESLLKKLAKENKELKLAQMNKPNVPASAASHSEAPAIVRDTVLTPDQEKTLREQRGWTDKDIERYKKNLAKNAIR